MKSKTRSLLEELDAMYVERDRRHVIETRAQNLISNAIRLLESIEEFYSPESAEILTKKLLVSIKGRDSGKFTRAVRRIDENLRSAKRNPTDSD